MVNAVTKRSRAISAIEEARALHQAQIDHAIKYPDESKGSSILQDIEIIIQKDIVLSVLCGDVISNNRAILLVNEWILSHKQWIVLEQNGLGNPEYGDVAWQTRWIKEYENVLSVLKKPNLKKPTK